MLTFSAHKHPHTQVIGNKWDTYLDLLQADYTEGCVLCFFGQPCFFHQFMPVACRLS